MACQHLRSGVTDSRAADALNPDGGRKFALLDYPCTIVRRRKCLDCGAKFSTVEISKEYMDAIKEKERAHKQALSAIQKYLEELK